MTTPLTEANTPVAERPLWRRYWLVGVTGVIVIPIALLFIFNSYGPPDDAAFVRMAFAEVAGAVIAIVTMLALAAASVMRRTPSVVLAVITVIVILNSASGLSQAAEMLLQRLG